MNLHSLTITFLDPQSIRYCGLTNSENKKTVCEIEDKLCIDEGFPKKYIDIFRKCNCAIWQLPVLELGNRKGSTGYIDFIKINEVRFPLMRFQDCHQRPGLIFKIKNDNNEAILILFKRLLSHTEFTRVWGGAYGNQFHSKYEERHDRYEHIGSSVLACPSCPFPGAKVSEKVITDLLMNNDSMFHLSKNEHTLIELHRQRHIFQVCNIL